MSTLPADLGSARAVEFMHANSLARSELWCLKNPRVCRVGESRSSRRR